MQESKRNMISIKQELISKLIVILILLAVSFLGYKFNIDVIVILSIIYIVSSGVDLVCCSFARENESSLFEKIYIIDTVFLVSMVIEILPTIDSRYNNFVVLKGPNMLSYYLLIVSIFMIFLECEYQEKRVGKMIQIVSYVSAYIFNALLILMDFADSAVIISLIFVLILNLKKSYNSEDKIIKDGRLNNSLYYTVNSLVLCVLISSILIVDKKTRGILILISNYLLFFNVIDINMKLCFILLNGQYNNMIYRIDETGSRIYKMNKKVNNVKRHMKYSKSLIKKEESIMDSFIANMPMPIITVNRETLRITFVNRSMLMTLGENDVKNIVNKKLTTIMSINDCEDYSNLEDAYGEINYKEKHIYINIGVFAIDETNENITLIIRDETEKIMAEKLKEDMKDKEYNEKIKRDFLSNISHDLKTPINVIYTAVQMMNIYNNEEGVCNVKKYNEIARNNCLSLIKYADNLINEGNISQGRKVVNKKICNICNIIENIVYSLEEYAKSKNIEIHFTSYEKKVFIEIDIEFMERIITNLISNSIKFIEGAGIINILVEDNGEKEQIVIEDNGIGMSEETLKTVFKRYYMGENNKNNKDKGAGLGLFLVNKMIDAQGGTIEAKSKENVGTKMIINFDKVK